MALAVLPEHTAYRGMALLVFMGIMLFTWLVLLYDLTLLFSADHIFPLRQAMWAMSLVTGSALVMPLFWYRFFYHGGDL